MKMMKTCPRCKKRKKIVKGFYINKYGKPYGYCRVCIIEETKTYYIDNKQKRRSYNKRYHKENAMRLRVAAKNRYYANREHRLSVVAKYRKDNHERILRSGRSHYWGNINFRIAQSLRRRVRKAVFDQGGKKMIIARLINCSIEEVKKHLESQFKNGMTWENYGYYGWHIDHIKPCASFDLTDPEQQKACFHYTNLQPLWAKENMQKSDKIV